MTREVWKKQSGETPAAYAAFCSYRNMDPRERSIDAAWRASNQQENRKGKTAPGHWTNWSTNNNWVARVAAYDEYVFEQDRLLWEQRRAELRKRDWEQADQLRGVVDEAIPHADKFFRRSRAFKKGVNGAPDTEVITTAFDISALTRVLVDASKLQRLATDEPTENINLSGASLDAAITRELARLADARQAEPPE